MKLKRRRPFIEDEADEIRFMENMFLNDLTHALASAIDARGSRKAVALAIDMAPQQLSELLSGEQNMTARTIARIAYAVDMFPRLRLADIASIDAPARTDSPAAAWTFQVSGAIPVASVEGFPQSFREAWAQQTSPTTHFLGSGYKPVVFAVKPTKATEADEHVRNILVGMGAA